MTKHVAVESLDATSSRRHLPSRRQVMIGAAGLSFACALGVGRQPTPRCSRANAPAKR